MAKGDELLFLRNYDIKRYIMKLIENNILGWIFTLFL